MKYLFIFIFIFIIHLQLNFNIIEIDNEIPLYEKNIDFSNNITDIKSIVLYLPQFHSIIENDKWWGKGFTEWTNVRKSKPIYNGHHQPRVPGDLLGYLGYYELINQEVIIKQVELAKSHGIYGFGIYYYWFSGQKLLEKPLEIIYNNKEIKIKYLLIWANENWTRRWDGQNDKILIRQKYKEDDPINFIKDIKKYLLDIRYIKINGKSVIGVYEPKKIPKLNETILKWREKAREFGIGRLYILVTLNNYNFEEFKNIKLFDAVYEFSPRDCLNYIIKDTSYYLYTSSLYKKYNSNITNDFPLFLGSMLEFDNSPRKKSSAIFKNYSPEQFYMINKKIINWTKEHYNENNRFIFINAWNEWGEGTYLEPDEKYGYASINALSKALYNQPYTHKKINLTNFNIKCIVAIQVHIYYENLIKEIIDKINNIPVIYDLYISTNSLKKKNNIENYVKRYSKTHKYEIVNVQNKGRDVFPLLTQMKFKIKKYKYFCHIHSKKTKFKNIGDDWRNYLIENLIGNKDIISEILSDFEKNEKLGFIFPETFYKVLLEYGEELTKSDKMYIDLLLYKIFHKFKIGKRLEYPIGNMFWSKVNSIYQIFELDIEKLIPKELGQLDGTIMHGIERIWLYLVKLNGYYYKKIFKHL